jgi:hypothetical protein
MRAFAINATEAASTSVLEEFLQNKIFRALKINTALK